MKFRVGYYCLPARRNAQYAVEEIHIHVDLPFVPQLGSWIKVTPDGEFMKVDDVYVDLHPGEADDALTVFCKHPEQHFELQPWREMKAQGWKLG